MIVGIVLSRELPAIESLVWFSIACGCIALSIRPDHGFKSVVLVAGVAALGAGLTQLRLNETPDDRLDRIVADTGFAHQRTPIEITGVLIEPIRTRHTPRSPGDPPMWKTTSVASTIGVDRVYMNDADGRGTWVDASGIARVVLPESMGDAEIVKPGDRVRVVGVFSNPGRARNFGDLDWGALNAQSGRVGTVVVTDESMISPIEHAGMRQRVTGGHIGWRSSLRVRALRALGVDSPGRFSDARAPRSMLGALLLGQRDPGFGEVYESFQRVGVAHVLAISGFHLALVIVLGVVLLRLIGEHPKIETAIIITILVLGALVIPMRPPIMRAGVIVIVLVIASRLGRRYDRLTILAWVGVGLLVWRPMDVYSLGYQLSMGITGLLVILSQREHMAVLNRSTFTAAKMRRGRGVIGRARVIVYETIKANFACWAVALPTIAYHAGIVSVLAPIVSLVLIPMVVLVMVLGYMQITLGVIAPEIATHTIAVIDWSGAFVVGFIGWVDSIPGSSVRVGSLGWVWTLCATAGIALVVTRRWKIRTRSVLIVGVGLIVWAVGYPMVMRDRAMLRIDMLDVGDGSCVLIQSGGEGLIWDCGSLDYRVGDRAARAARQVGLTRIRDAIITHDNIDHFNGLIDLATDIGLERVWITQRMLDDPSPGWAAFESRLISMGVTIHEIGAGTKITLGEVTLECIWPNPSLIESMSENNTSVVVRIEVPVDGDLSRTVLLTGDIERDAMDAIMQSHPDVHADIVELPHHGSTKPGAYGFVRQLDPSVVLQSTGPTRLDHPHWDGLRVGRDWYTSADQGGVWVKIMPTGEIVHGWAKPRGD